MDKEKILEASRKENQNRDIYELEVIKRGQRIGALTAVCIAALLLVVENLWLDKGTNYGYYIIIMSSAAGVWIYKAIKMKITHEIFLAVLWTAVAVYAVVMYILTITK